MTRKELYAKVKELHLEWDIKATFGKNYTLVSNADLEDIVKQSMAIMNATAQPAAPQGSCLSRAFVKLVSYLRGNRVISPENADDVLTSL